MKEDFVFFWGSENPYSNWYLSPFRFNNVNYNCSEQYMMHMKAEFFDDHESIKKVLKETSPYQQKKLGRAVRGFNKVLWERACENIMVPALVAKFQSTPELTEYILSSEDKEIVEASPVDKIWGIGLAEDDPRAWNKTTWQGLNLLGKCLMRARDVVKG